MLSVKTYCYGNQIIRQKVQLLNLSVLEIILQGAQREKALSPMPSSRENIAFSKWNVLCTSIFCSIIDFIMLITASSMHIRNERVEAVF